MICGRVVLMSPPCRPALYPATVLQRLPHPDLALFMVRITGMALAWIGSTKAFDEVVKNP